MCVVAGYLFALTVARLADAVGRHWQTLCVVVTGLRSPFALVQRVTVDA